MSGKKRPKDKYLRDMTWGEKAEQNPLYAVMSIPEFLSSSSEPTEQELDRFFSAGKEKVDKWIIPWLTRFPG